MNVEYAWSLVTKWSYQIAAMQCALIAIVIGKIPKFSYR